jgi:protein-L-isoaspartate O-methyltransferase
MTAGRQRLLRSEHVLVRERYRRWPWVHIVPAQSIANARRVELLQSNSSIREPLTITMSDSPTSAGAPNFARMDVAAFLATLGFAADTQSRYAVALRERGVRTAAELQMLPEDDLSEFGIMRGHARRIIMEFQRLQSMAIVPPSSGMERHGSLLDPSPLTTPVTGNQRRFPRSSSSGILTSPTGPVNPVMPTPTALPPSPATGPADRALGTLEVQHFTCFICMDFIVSPRTITCGHSFCAHCIAHWAEVREEASCPLCRTAMRVAAGERVTLPPLNKMLDEVSRHAFPQRYRLALRRVEAAVKEGMELRKWQLFTRHPANALLVKITCDSLSGGTSVPRALELTMLRMPRQDFLPPRIDLASHAVSCETGPSRIEALNFNVTAASIQAAVLSFLEIQPGHTFLDVGTGSGCIATWASALVGPTGAVLGIDSDAAACGYARRNVAIQFRKALAEAPPHAPLRPRHCTTWWVHPGCTAVGRAALLEPIPATKSNARRTRLDEDPGSSPCNDPITLSTAAQDYDQVSIRITHFDPVTMAVEASIVSGKVYVRHARARGILQVQDVSGANGAKAAKTARAQGLKPVRARPNPGDDSGRPLTKPKSDPVVYRLPTSRDASPVSDETGFASSDGVANAAGPAGAGGGLGPSSSAGSLWRHIQELPKAALHLEEVLVFGDNPKSAYHFVNRDTMQPADDPTIAGTRLHYVLRLTISSAVRNAVSELASLDGFVGFKTAKGKMMKIAEVSLTMDEATVKRIRSWETAHPPLQMATSGRRGVDSEVDSDADQACVDPPLRPHTPPPSRGTRATPPKTAVDSDADGGVVGAGSSGLHSASEWFRLEQCLSRVHIAQLNVYDLVGSLSQHKRETVQLMCRTLNVPEPTTLGDTPGLFDRIFIGAEPQSDREFTLLLALLKDQGRMVIPYKSELLLLGRDGDNLVCQPRMNVSFGPLVYNDSMLNTATETREELEAARNSPALDAEAVQSIFSPLNADPSALAGSIHGRAGHKVFYSTCCGAPLMPGYRHVAKPERTLGDKLRILDDHVHLFAPLSPSITDGSESPPQRPSGGSSGTPARSSSVNAHQLNASGAGADEDDDDAAVAQVTSRATRGKPAFESFLSDAFDGAQSYVSGLGCSVVYVKCPCGKPVGVRVASPATHAPSHEKWEGSVLLAHRFVTTSKQRNGASGRSTPSQREASPPRLQSSDVCCLSCRSVFAHRTKLVRETMDWFDIPSTSTPNTANPPASDTAALTRSQSQIPPSSASEPHAFAGIRFVTTALFDEVDSERVVLSSTYFNHATSRSVVPCRYKLVSCAVCRSPVGCHVLGPLHAQDLPPVASLCGRYIILLSRVHGLQSSQRLDVLQRVFSAILGQGSMNEAPPRRLNASELMEFFSSGASDEDEDPEGSEEDEGDAPAASD